MENQEQNSFPTETVELPSKGLIYPEDHPLRSGKVEMKYMTAKEEDILTNQNFIEKGVVLDKLLESLTMKKFNIKDIHPGDKNAILVASRILGYGKDYEFEYEGTKYTVDLSLIDNKPFNTQNLTEKGYTRYTLPSTEQEVVIRFLTEKDEEDIEREIKNSSKVGIQSGEITTRLKHQIMAVGDVTDRNEIRKFVENHLLARDSRSLRNYIKDASPDVDLKFSTDSGEEVAIPITLNFFWPDL